MMQGLQLCPDFRLRSPSLSEVLLLLSDRPQHFPLGRKICLSVSLTQTLSLWSLTQSKILQVSRDKSKQKAVGSWKSHC